MGEWWINDSGLNLLKGVDGDETNPIRLGDDYILDFIRRIPAARDSFNRLVPQMLEAEQARLRGIAESAQFMMPDYKAVEDMFQASQNKVGVHTAGRYGGTRRGGNG